MKLFCRQLRDHVLTGLFPLLFLVLSLSLSHTLPPSGCGMMKKETDEWWKEPKSPVFFSTQAVTTKSRKERTCMGTSRKVFLFLVAHGRYADKIISGLCQHSTCTVATIKAFLHASGKFPPSEDHDASQSQPSNKPWLGNGAGKAAMTDAPTPDRARHSDAGKAQPGGLFAPQAGRGSSD